jgi:hypothetical protein
MARRSDGERRRSLSGAETKTKPQRIMPTWAPRVTQEEIRRLYGTDAKGIYDEDLINEVGHGLLARCQSFVDAMEATWGKARCPCCSAVVAHTGGKDERLRCACGWELTWGEYYTTIQHKQLSGAEPVLAQFRAFIAAFATARTPQDKTILIDRLLHGFHWYYKTQQPTRPVAINLIEGRLGEVVTFLDELSRGEKSSPGVGERFTEWLQNIDVNRQWYPSREKGKQIV